MKKIENFGDFLVNHFIWFIAFAGVVAIGLSVYANVHSVTISDKEFRCAEASPDGLGTKCDTYIRRVK